LISQIKQKYLKKIIKNKKKGLNREKNRDLRMPNFLFDDEFDPNTIYPIPGKIFFWKKTMFFWDAFRICYSSSVIKKFETRLKKT